MLVRPKPGILDPQGQAVESSLRHLGFASARRASAVSSTSRSRPTTAAEALDQLGRMCEQLLANALIESYEIELEGEPVRA